MVRQLSGQGLVTVHVNGRAPAAHVEHQGYKWNAACYIAPFCTDSLHELRGCDARLNLVVKLEQKNYEPRDKNIQLNGINTVCLKREWCFNVFIGLAHKYLWSVHREGRTQSA